MGEEGPRRGFTRRGLLVAGASTAVAAGGYACVDGVHGFASRRSRRWSSGQTCSSPAATSGWALPEAFEDLGARGDRRAIARRTYALAARLKEGLAEIPGMRVKTPRDEALSSGLVCAVIPRLTASTIVERLREEHRVVASVTPYVWQYVRFGPSIANSDDDMDEALEAVAAVVG